MRIPISRFRQISVSNLFGAHDLLANAVYLIKYGRGSKEKPISISLPWILYEKVPQFAEILSLLTNYSELLSKLRRNKYYGKSERELLLELVKESQVSIQALEQVLLDDLGKATSTLEN